MKSICRVTAIRTRLIGALAITISTSAAHGGAQVITFDELPKGTIVDGMVIGNVTFGFSSADATITLIGPGDTFFIDPPNIEGDAFGTLTLEFAIPVLELSYGFALSSFVPSAIGSTMEVFDPDGFSLGIFSEPAADFGFGFVEGLNSAGGVGAIGSAVITFGPTNAPRFALDNLTMLKVPGPGSLAMLGVAGLMGTRRRRRG